MPQRRLKRQLALAQIAVLGMAGTIDAQIFVLTGHAAGIAGPATLLALLAGGLLSYSVALNYCELATTYPATGGAMTCVREAWGNNLLSVLVGSLDCLSNTFFNALSSVGLAYALQALIPSLSMTPVAAAVIVGFTALNPPGGFRRETFLAGGRSFPHAGPADNAVGTLRALALICVAYSGFEVIADDAEEVREPDRNLPRGILISLTLVIVLNVP